MRREAESSSIRHDDTFVVESFASKRALTLRAEIPGQAAPNMPGAVEWIDALTQAGGNPAQDGGNFSTRPFEQPSSRTNSFTTSFSLPSMRQSFVGEKADAIETMETTQLRESYSKLQTEYTSYKATTQKEIANLREEIRLLCARPRPRLPFPPHSLHPITAPRAQPTPPPTAPPRPPIVAAHELPYTTPLLVQATPPQRDAQSGRRRHRIE